MNDSISSRIRRIITGTAHSIVARIEGLAPEAVLEQAIGEVDDALDEVRAELGKVVAQKHHVTKTITRLNTTHASLDEQVETAFAEGRKDLVEVALARQVDIEDQLPALENQLADLRGQEQEFNQAATGLIAKRNEMEDELFAFKRQQANEAAAAAGDATLAPGSADSPLNRAERAENAFSRVISDVTGVRRSTFRSSNEDSAKLVELAQLNRRARIEAKMKALEEGSGDE